MRPHSLSIFLTALLSLNLHGAEGPGFPNIDYQPASSGTRLSLNDPGKAISAVAMHRGYLFVPLGADHGGGQGTGAFAFYDISNPANPNVVFDSRSHPTIYHGSGSTDYAGDYAEIHHLPISDDYMLISERRNNSAGYCILDVSPLYDNPSNPHPRVVSRFSFPGVTSPSSYDGYSFAPGWQGRKYLWAPTGSNGLMIVDTSNFASPQMVAAIPRSRLANLTLRSAIPIGNLLILDTVAIGGTFTTLVLDIADPANPQILNSFSGPLGYQPFIHGSKHYGGGIPLVEHDFSDPYNITSRTLVQNPPFQNPEYGFGKDDFIFVGHYPGLTKWQVSGTGATLVETVDSGLVDDHAFISPIGNLAAITSDHNNDRKLILGIHDHRRDTTPPSVNFVSPADGSTNVHVKSRVGLCFTDFIDQTTVDASSLRVQTFGGTPVPGTFSTMMGIVNFAPDQDLAPNETYQVILAAGGVSDQCGNAIPAETVVATFATGAMINTFATAVIPGSPLVAGSTASLSLTVDNPAGLALEHSWDFGDGSPATPFSSTTTASHLYASPGNHVVSVSTRTVGQTNSRRSTAVQIIHAPLAASPPVASSSIVFDASNNLVWNVNPDSGSVTAIDASTHAKLREIPVGSSPKSLALAPGNRLWVANKHDATISVIDRGTGAVSQTLSLPRGCAPHAVLVDIPENRAYVSLEATGRIAKLDATSGVLLGLLDVGPWPRALALDPTRQRLWVARFISPDDSGQVTSINTATFSVAATTPLAPVMEPDSLFNGRGLPNYLGAMAISPDVTQVFVPAKKDNIFRGLLRDGRQLTFEHTVRSMATRIDLGSGTEDGAARIDFDNNDFATAAAFSPLGNQVFFSTNGSALIWVVDAYDPSNWFTFASGGIAPDGLALNADGSRLFVHNFMSRDVTVFRTGIVCASACGSAPLLATVRTVANESLTPDVLLGKQLFYRSNDPRLSQESYMSCASCHLDGGHDGRVWDFTGMGEGLRNTIDLNGRGAGHGPVHWSANFDEVQDFEGQLRDLSGGTGLMDDADFHQGSRSRPLGLAKAGVSPDLDALASYVASLTPAGDSPHRGPDGELTPDALAGREIFRALSCASCHSGTAFTDSISLVRHDVGTLASSSGQRLGAFLGGLDTPTLRGLWAGAPYLHDGSAATLREVLTTRNLGGHHGDLFSLSSTEIDQLVDYLMQIDDAETTAPANGTNGAPILADPGPRSVSACQSFQLALSASDPEGAPLHFSATGLPEGLAIDPSTGVIAGAPSSPGEHTVRIGVRDPAGNTASLTLYLNVTDIGLGISDVETLAGPYRHVKLVALSEANGNGWASMADFHLLDENGQVVDRSGWTATASSAETSSSSNGPSLAIDGSTSTLWHTRYSGANVPKHPHEFIVDLGQAALIGGFRQTPRTDGSNGRIGRYEFHGSSDGVIWNLITEGTFPNSSSPQTVSLLTASRGITAEWWSGFTGNSLAALEAWPAFPENPSGSAVLGSFEATGNRGNQFGSRLHGYLVAPETGDYAFAVAADDSGELRLGTNHLASSASVIASNPAWTGPLQWDKYPGQQSAPVRLEAGRLYYIAGLYHETSGGDHFTAGWKRPGSDTIQVIPGQFLLPYQQLSPNAPPVFPVASHEFFIRENAGLSSLVGIVSASDPGQVISYRIAAGNGTGTFAINPTTGAITLAATLDFDTRSSFQLLVEATDNHEDPLSAAIPVSIRIGNVLENNAEVVRAGLTGSNGAYPGHGNPAIVGFNADPDGDGIANALELLYGTDPSTPDVLPPIRVGHLQEGEETYATYEIDIASNLDGILSFKFLGGDNLTTWSPLRTGRYRVANFPGRFTYKFRDDFSLDDAPRRFVRVAVQPDEGGESP